MSKKVKFFNRLQDSLPKDAISRNAPGSMAARQFVAVVRFSALIDQFGVISL